MSGRFEEVIFDGPRALVRAWLALAVAALGISVVFAALLVIGRTPLAGQALSGAAFRRALVLHVNLATLVWFLSFAAALWSADCPPRRRATLWVAWALAALGAAVMLGAGIGGFGEPVLSNYIPLLNHPLYLGGLLWFSTGIGVTAVIASPGGAQNPLAPLQWARLPFAMALLALVAALSRPGAGGVSDSLESLVWGPGHLMQFGYVVVLMVAWLQLSDPIASRAASPRWLRALIAAAAFPVLVAPMLMVDSAASGDGRAIAYTQLMRWALWPAPTLLAVWLATRASPGRDGWASTDHFGLMGSIALFAIGCACGAAIRDDSTLVPAHYHGTIGAVTAALMALAYRMLPAVGEDPVASCRARLQLAAYVIGLITLIAGLAWGGWLGAPRKAAFSLEHATFATIAAASLVGVGGATAVCSAALFAATMLRRLLRPLVRFTGWRNPLDVRSRALGATLASVVILGSFLALLPAGQQWSRWFGIRDAQAYADHARTSRETEVRARFDQGVLMLHSKQYDPAVTAFHRVLELAPQMPEAHVNMGFALLGLQQHAAARDFFESATELRRDQLNAYYGLALALEGVGDLHGAVGAMRAYVHRGSPEDPFYERATAALAKWEREIAATGG